MFAGIRRVWAVPWCLAATIACAVAGCAVAPDGTGGGIVPPGVFGEATSYEHKVIPLKRGTTNLYLARVRVKGTEPEKDILLLHGSSLASKEFDCDCEDYSLAKRLAHEGYAVWLLDISGYGQSDEVADGRAIDRDFAAADVDAAVDRILMLAGRPRLDVLGWSWGTVYGSDYVAAHPGRVRRLVLYAPIARGLGIERTDEPFHELTWEDAAEDFQRAPDGSIDPSITDPAVVGIFCSDAWHYNKARVPTGWQADAAAPADETLIDFSSIPVPTLLIYGDRDPYVDAGAIQGATEVLPEGSAVRRVAGASHAMMLEKPYHWLFQEAVVDFLSQDA